MVLFIVDGRSYSSAERLKYVVERFGGGVVSYGYGLKFFNDRGEVFPLEFSIVRKVKEINDLERFLTSLIGEKVLDKIKREDLLVVDSFPLGLLFAVFFKKKFLFISSFFDLDSFVKELWHMIDKHKLLEIFKNSSIVVPDYPPPFSICQRGLDDRGYYKFIGPTVYVGDISLGSEIFPVAADEGDKWDIELPKYTVGNIGCRGCKEVKDVRKFYGMAKLIISRGEHSTIMSALALGKPLVVIPNNNEQKVNAKGVYENQVGLVFDHNYVDSHSLEMAVDAVSFFKKKVLFYSKHYRALKGYKTLYYIIDDLI